MNKAGTFSRLILGKGSGAAGARSDVPVNEISKKDLLKRTGLSYGQLYRWKRMGLIPEAWFIRRSTFTGQETFFPKAQVIERIETIQRLKDRYSLEELAELLSPASATRRYARADVCRLNSLSQEGLGDVDDVYRAAGRDGRGSDERRNADGVDHAGDDSLSKRGSYTFVDLVAAAVATEMRERNVPRPAILESISTMIAGAPQFATLDGLHVVCAYMDDQASSFALLYAGHEPVVFGHSVNVQADIPVGPHLEAIRQEVYRQFE